MPDFESSPSRQPMLLSLGRAVVKRVGSLLVTVAILTVLIAILLWGTVIEKNYGATAAKFGVYGAWWFNTLGLLLGLNAAAGLVLRLPWKRQQLGFVVPHIGLIVLLVGCFISRRYGIEATLPVLEGDSSDLAYKGPEQHPELDGQLRFALKVIPDSGRKQSAAPTVVAFTPGPFNWDDYHNGTLGVLPWSLAHRDRGVLYDHDGIRLEVLDYLSNSEMVNLPSLAVEAVPLGQDGREVAERAQLCRFSVKADAGPHSAGSRFVRRQRTDVDRRPANPVLDDRQPRRNRGLPTIEAHRTAGQARPRCFVRRREVIRLVDRRLETGNPTAAGRFRIGSGACRGCHRAGRTAGRRPTRCTGAVEHLSRGGVASAPAFGGVSRGVQPPGLRRQRLWGVLAKPRREVQRSTAGEGRRGGRRQANVRTAANRFHPGCRQAPLPSRVARRQGKRLGAAGNGRQRRTHYRLPQHARSRCLAVRRFSAGGPAGLYGSAPGVRQGRGTPAPPPGPRAAYGRRS